MFIGASVVTRENHSNPKRLISGGGGIQINSGGLNIVKFCDQRYWSFSFTRISNWRNFGQMTNVLSDENAKIFATFFDPNR